MDSGAHISPNGRHRRVDREESSFSQRGCSIETVDCGAQGGAHRLEGHQALISGFGRGPCNDIRISHHLLMAQLPFHKAVQRGNEAPRRLEHTASFGAHDRGGRKATHRDAAPRMRTQEWLLRLDFALNGWTEALPWAPQSTDTVATPYSYVHGKASVTNTPVL
ncbi:hypothetical protein BDV98DRAFT_385711 [Pterulicium gracile]|uniref:Uncharacterized protein n=1 Tax=Pterulicium gracile TaxID=1884261 RepID=A0A5C3QRK8_9AGAR|nr:hypothetical protein BDV98DRAFT_385711 [Pterula gracilis]